MDAKTNYLLAKKIYLDFKSQISRTNFGELLLFIGKTMLNIDSQ